MRVVVATGPIAGLTSAQAGAAVAHAWADVGAHLAVMPIAEAGAGFTQAWADLTRASQLPGHSAAFHGPAGLAVDATRAETAAEVCRSLVQALDLLDGRDAQAGLEVWLEARGTGWPDGPQGFWGAAEPLGAGRGSLRLHLVTDSGEQGLHLTGFRGITAAHGRASGMHPGDMLAADQALVDWCTSVAAESLGTTAGAGAVGGLGAAVLALGGDVVTGPDECARLGRLADSVAVSDLVVTGCDELDFGTKGGDLLPAVVGTANEAGRPAIAVARRNWISARELRTMGVEQAYDLAVDDTAGTEGTAAAVQREAQRIARSWTW